MDLGDLPLTSTADVAEQWSRRWLDAALRHGDLVQLGVGQVVGVRYLGRDPRLVHALQVRAAMARLHEPAVASHGSAAVLQDLARLGRPSGTVRLTRTGTRYRRLTVDARLHTAGLPESHVTTAFGIAVTTPARTAVDLARLATFRSGVVVADSAARLGCTRAEFDCVLRDCARWPGIRRARKAVEFARPEAETPLESVSRAFFIERDIPMPELQVEMLDALRRLRRLDFYWRAQRTIGEADGMAKYDDPSALRLEKLRQEALEQTGHVVVRWTWQELWREPDRTEGRIRDALRRGQRLAG